MPKGADVKLIESKIRGKRYDQSQCEDGMFVGSRLAVVIDGVTAHGKLRWNGGSSGRFAKEVLCEFLRTHEEELAVLSAGEFMRRLNDILAEKVEEVRPGPKALEEYPRACIVLYNAVAREVWSYGDCQCMIGGELHHKEKEVDRLLSELRQFVIESEVLKAERAGESAQEYLEQVPMHDLGREIVSPLIERQMLFENTPRAFGYPVLNGLNFAQEMIKVWPVPEGAEVVLASDGYPELCGTLAESEARLKEILAEDPLCIGRNAGTKGIMEGQESFDDRTYVRVVSGE